MLTATPKMNTIDILDYLNEFQGWTDYRIAKMLEISQSTISNYRNRGTVMRDDIALKAAPYMHLPANLVVQNIRLERSQRLHDEAREKADKEILEAVETQNKEAIKASDYPYQGDSRPK